MGKEEDTKGVAYKGLIEESAEDLYENAPCGYLSTLPNGIIVKINKTLVDWLGYEKEELLEQKKFQDLLSIGGKLYYETHYGPLLRMQGFIREINFDMKGKQGQQLPVLVNTIQLKGDDGNPQLNRTTLFNITDRKKYEQELLRAKKQAEEAARVKAEFLSTVSHEIRTPLNAIVSIANLLQGTEQTSEQEEYFRTLKLSADNLLHLITDILDYSKIEAGRVELAEKNLNLKELVYSLLYSIGITAEEKGLAIKVDIDEKLPAQVIGDPVKIGQVLTNLLSNAIKFTERGHVLLKLQVQELKEKEVFLNFVVTDTGIGIPQDKQDKIFKEFTQADYEINLKYGGTGLGLAISQKLLALYGSKLSVKSEEGKGTEFSFNLHLKLAKNPFQETENTTTRLKQSIKGVRLLLVEDNDVNVMVISKYLDKWGVAYDVAGDGVEAVEMVQQQEYELVLMDLQMPGMDGYEASSTIRELDDTKYKQLPIIALSASARFDYKERMEVAGINDFVNKPFNPKELYNKIAYYSRSIAHEEHHIAKSKQSHSDQQQLTETGSAIPAFALATFEELLEGNQEDLEELIKITIPNFEEARRELRTSLLRNDLKGFKTHFHKIKMTVELLHAHNLLAAVTRGRDLLDEDTKDRNKLEKASLVINQEFDIILTGLKETLINRRHDAFL